MDHWLLLRRQIASVYSARFHLPVKDPDKILVDRTQFSSLEVSTVSKGMALKTQIALDRSYDKQTAFGWPYYCRIDALKATESLWVLSTAASLPSITALIS